MVGDSWVHVLPSHVHVSDPVKEDDLANRRVVGHGVTGVLGGLVVGDCWVHVLPSHVHVPLGSPFPTRRTI